MSAIHEQGQATPEMRECTYRLFRNRQRPQIICAVSAYRPLPAFLNEEQWQFERMLRRTDPALPGFRERAAATGVRLNGFYLFQTFRTEHALRLSEDRSA